MTGKRLRRFPLLRHCEEAPADGATLATGGTVVRQGLRISRLRRDARNGAVGGAKWRLWAVTAGITAFLAGHPATSAARSAPAFFPALPGSRRPRRAPARPRLIGTPLRPTTPPPGQRARQHRLPGPARRPP